MAILSFVLTRQIKTMKPETRKEFLKLRADFRNFYQVFDPAELFTVKEPMETQLHAAIQASDEFLKAITMLPVSDRDGQNIELGLYSPIAKRTNNQQKDRTCTPIGGPDGLRYRCTLTEYDICFDYDTLDAWARQDNFRELYLRAVTRRIALDRLQVGWLGKSIALESDPKADPDRSDINVGWLQLLQDHNPINYLTESTPGKGKITIGPNGDYKNLDSLTIDVWSMIDEKYRTGSEIAIIGHHLITDSVINTLSQYGQRPTEKKLASDVSVLEGSFGGLRAIRVPGFPARGVCVTDPQNLCLYYQEGQTRRKQQDNPRKNQIEVYMSCNDAYCISNLNAIAAIDAEVVEFAA